MLSSSTLSNSSSSPIFYVDNISSYLIDDSTYYSTSYYHSPSPLIYNEIDYFGDFITNHELSIIQQSMLANNNNNSSIDIPDDSSILELDTKVDSNKSGDHESEIINGIVEDNGEMNHIISSSTTTTTTTSSPRHGVMKKKRSSNKDRHSKIRTAHGLRDRRMRLSLQVARSFFNLQDMLGYDKASTTVEWLMIQSKPAIDELLQSKHGSPPSGVTTTKCTTSSNSDDGEVESTTIEERDGDNPKEKRVSSTTKEETKQKRKRTKEERKVAREWARKRTESKQSRGNITNSFTTNSSNYQQSFNVSQNVPSYRISAQQNIMGGPQ